MRIRRGRCELFFPPLLHYPPPFFYFLNLRFFMILFNFLLRWVFVIFCWSGLPNSPSCVMIITHSYFFPFFSFSVPLPSCLQIFKPSVDDDDARQNTNFKKINSTFKPSKRTLSSNEPNSYNRKTLHTKNVYKSRIMRYVCSIIFSRDTITKKQIQRTIGRFIPLPLSSFCLTFLFTLSTFTYNLSLPHSDTFFDFKTFLHENSGK